MAFDPQPGNSFEIITATDIDGEFDTISGRDLGGGKVLFVDYSATAVTVGADTVAGLDVVPASATVPVGFPVNLAAMAQLSLGGAADVSDLATWSSDDPSVATVDPSGQVRGIAEGSTTIHASFAGFMDSATVEVQPLPSQLATERVSLSFNGRASQRGQLCLAPTYRPTAATWSSAVQPRTSSNRIRTRPGTSSCATLATGNTIRVSVDLRRP